MKLKKIISLLLALFLIVSIIPSVDVSASGYTLEQLKAKFPDGKYWNHQVKSGHGYNGISHYGSNCGDIENSVTSNPCSTHSGTAGIGGYDCNTYRNLGMQCNGFARKLANLVYGVNDCVSVWSTVTNKSSAISQVKPGDVIHYKGDDADSKYGHWVFVTAVSGSTVTLGECNYGGTPSCNCLIRWGRQLNLNNVSSLTLYKAPYAMPRHTHKYDKSTYMCSCGAFNRGSITTTTINQTMQITKDAIDHSGPYGDCKIVNEYKKGATVIATQKVINGYGSVWYKLSNGHYIYSDYVKNVSSSYPAISAGTYYVKNVATGTWLSVSEGKDINMNAVNLWTNTGDAMKMVIAKAPTGYKIRPYVCKSRLVNPNAVHVSHGNNINIYDDVNDSSQWWQFEKVGNYYVIHNVQNPSCVLDAPSGKTSIAYARTYTGANSQKWILECVEHANNEGAVTVKATCTKAGEKTYTCTRCNASYTQTIPATGHKFGNWKVTKIATCTSTGIESRSCSYCNKVETRNIAATGHNKYYLDGKSATCTEFGLTPGVKCSICSSLLSGYEIIAPTGHNWVCDVFSSDEYCTNCHARRPGTHIPEVQEPTTNRPEVIEPTTRVPDESEECTTQIQEPDTDALPGDVDDDGQVTASDARIALRASVGLEALPSGRKAVADMDSDGEITASDARKILRIAVGLDKN